MTTKSMTMLAICGWCCAAALGCASNTLGGFGGEKNLLRDFTPEGRREEAIENFAHRRQSVEYSAALSRWNVGDVAGCEAVLKTLLQRNPGDRQARRLLADVCLERSDLAGAEAHLRALLESDPEDAQSHHSLGLLLEEADLPEESLWHLDRAVALDPHNELYVLSRDAAVRPAALR